jgi:FKBP-type peptidyl-prolyl cis-trans isomerase SlyD
MNMSENTPIIKKDMIVELQYVLYADGKRLGNCDPDPVIYLHGNHQIIPGFEKGTEGLKVGDTKTFEVSPADGYGYREEKATIVMPKSDFPKELPLKPGAELQMVNEDGEEMPGWLTQITDDTITVDFNHPLAEKTLRFDVEILSIRKATEEELNNQDTLNFV